MLDPAQVGLEVEQTVVGEERIDKGSLLLEVCELADPVQVCCALGVQVLLGLATEHQRQDNLHEQIRLQVGLGGDGLREPRLDLVPAGLGDVVSLAIGLRSRFGLADDRSPVSRQAGERGVHLAVGQRSAGPAEVGVVIACFRS